MKLIAVSGTRQLWADDAASPSDPYAQGFVLDTATSTSYPPHAIQAILSRGGWEPPRSDPPRPDTRARED